MPRINSVQSARASKKERRCATCRHEIQIGETYRYIDKKTGPSSGYRVIFCSIHFPRPSQLLSGRAAELAAIFESIQDAFDEAQSVADVAEALHSAAEEGRSLAEDIRSAAESIEDGFGHETQQSENMKETADNIDEWAERIEEAARDLDPENATDEENQGKEDQEGETDDTDDPLDAAIAAAQEALSDEPALNLSG